jgi:hypothetical protein
MSRTLNELIAEAIFGDSDSDQVESETVDDKVAVAPAVEAPDLQSVEKVATALEAIATHLPVWWGEKQASSTLNKNSPTNNSGRMHGTHTQSQVGPNSASPPMKQSASGPVETNAGKKPGLPAPKDGVDTSSTEHGSSHPALSGNESAMNIDKKVKTKRTAAALKKVLSARAYADGKLKENLTNASGKGDKNIHKTASAEAVQAELERRRAAGGGE